MKTPKISVVTPSFNQGQYIEEVIQSILNQDYQHFEHIIIDACSTDNTLAVLKKYPHLIWTSEPDKGQSDALNKGFLRASGDWILWLNADDILLPNTFTTIVEEINKNVNWAVIHGNVTFFHDKTKKVYRNQFFTNYNHNNSLFNVVIPPSTGTFFEAQFLKKSLLDINFHYMMDKEWYMKYGKDLKIRNIDYFFVKFRISENNKTGSQITDGVVNKQMKMELDKLYKTYTEPAIKWCPRILQKSLFKFCKRYFLLLNKVKRIKYIFKIKSDLV